MNQATAIQRLNHMDKQSRYVFNRRDLEKLFPEDNANTFHAGLNRLVAQNILQRAVRGVYVFTLSHKQKSSQTLELIAKTLRRGKYNYVSLESALSEYGAISQIPVDRLTVMTTGRKGEYKTPFGTLEFVHTKRSVNEILKETSDVGRPLRMASLSAAHRDLKRVGRNTHLVDMEVIREN